MALLMSSITPLGAAVDPFPFAPKSRRQDHIGKLTGLGIAEGLDQADKFIGFAHGLQVPVQVGQGLGRVGAENEQGFQLAVTQGIKHGHGMETWFGIQRIRWQAPQLFHFVAMFLIGDQATGRQQMCQAPRVPNPPAGVGLTGRGRKG